ncbi:MAG: type II toxin-antitoxin system VapC family toxin [Burkholderiales bacterium]
MIGVDANVLARYCVEYKADAQAMTQRQAAWRLIESGQPLMVCKTDILEFEWVLRGHYGFEQEQTAAALRHLLSMAHISVEDRATVLQALSHSDAGIDFADALHHASYRGCESMASFDDRKVARRAKKMGLAPAESAPV